MTLVFVNVFFLTKISKQLTNICNKFITLLKISIDFTIIQTFLAKISLFCRYFRFLYFIFGFKLFLWISYFLSKFSLDFLILNISCLDAPHFIIFCNICCSKCLLILLFYSNRLYFENFKYKLKCIKSYFDKFVITYWKQ